MGLDVHNQQPPQSAIANGGVAPFSVISGGGALAHWLHPSAPITLDLFDTKKLEHCSPCLHLAAKTLLHVKESDQQQRKLSKSFEMIMNQTIANGSKLDLKLNLSTPRAPRVELNSSIQSALASLPSSCVSSEEDATILRYSNSPKPISMVLVGCTRCLIYVILSKDDPKCPKYKSTILFDFHHDTTTSTIAIKAAVATANTKTRKS